MTRGTYSETRKVLADDVNMLREMRHSVFLRWLQEISIAHTEKLGAGRDKTLDRGALWIIARARAEIARMPVYDETVTLRSWPGYTMHVLFPRYYELTDANGGVLIRASAVWLLMDADTRKMAFPDKYGVKLPGVVTGTELALPTGLAEEYTDRSAYHRAAFSEVDINGHMNNAKYVDIAEDLPGFGYMTSHKATALEIEYKSEVKAGARIRLLWRADGDGIYVRGQRGSGESFRLKISCEPR